jgi:hypothetical protein
VGIVTSELSADFEANEPTAEAAPTAFLRASGKRARCFQPSKIKWKMTFLQLQHEEGPKPRRACAHKKMGFEPIGATDPALGLLEDIYCCTAENGNSSRLSEM